MFSLNDERKKFYADDPLPSIFDGPAVNKALSVRASCNYPGSIIDHLKHSQMKKPQTSARAGMGRHFVGTASDTVVPSGEHSDSSSSISTEDNGNDRVPDLMPEAHDSTVSGSKAGETSNTETQNGAAQVEETIIRRWNKKSELQSSSDSESDTELCTSGYVSKGRPKSRSKSRKRKKKLTANLSGTRYDVGKNQR